LLDAWRIPPGRKTVNKIARVRTPAENNMILSNAFLRIAINSILPLKKWNPIRVYAAAGLKIHGIPAQRIAGISPLLYHLIFTIEIFLCIKYNFAN
jgi:hypothetical protein